MLFPTNRFDKHKRFMNFHIIENTILPNTYLPRSQCVWVERLSITYFPHRLIHQLLLDSIDNKDALMLSKIGNVFECAFSV